jgi:hypothetical protein
MVINLHPGTGCSFAADQSGVAEGLESKARRDKCRDTREIKDKA